MRKASIFVILSFLSVTILHAEIVPVKKSTALEAYLFTEFSYPVKRPPQPLLSQILSNKDYELFELANKYIMSEELELALIELDKTQVLYPSSSYANKSMLLTAYIYFIQEEC